MRPSALSQYLRESSDPELSGRRWVVGLSLLGTAAGQIVTMYQTGIIRHLPDPPEALTGDWFDSDKVDASDYAYKRLNMPDAPLMILTYGVTAALAAAGGPDRPYRQPWLPIAMAGKALYDVATTIKLGQEEWQENKAFCLYCQAATVASFVIAALALPEAWRAVTRLLR